MLALLGVRSGFLHTCEQFSEVPGCRPGFACQIKLDLGVADLVSGSGVIFASDRTRLVQTVWNLQKTFWRPISHGFWRLEMPAAVICFIAPPVNLGLGS